MRGLTVVMSAIKILGMLTQTMSFENAITDWLRASLSLPALVLFAFLGLTFFAFFGLWLQLSFSIAELLSKGGLIFVAYFQALSEQH